jgi:ribosome-binding factor A
VLANAFVWTPGIGDDWFWSGMSQRTERIDELLRQEITEILAREVSDPRIGFVTVTDVETAPDLRHARVWVSVIGAKSERDETLAALGRAMVFVRRELGSRLRLKRIPELHVRLDDTAERGTRVLQLLHELEEGRVPEEVPPPDESLPTPTARLPHEGDAPTEPTSWAEPEAERGRNRSGTRRPELARRGRPRGGSGRTR